MTEQLVNILLYGTSAAAQVWSALLVFRVLLVRDAKTSIEDELDKQWQISQIWCPKFFSNLVDPNGRTLSKELEKYDLDEQTVKTAMSSRESFIKVIISTKKHQLAILDGKSLCDITGRHNFSPKDGQLKFDKIADLIEGLLEREHKFDERQIFILGLIGVVVNLILLSISFGLSNCFLWSLWILMLLFNSIALIWFTRSTIDLLETRKSKPSNQKGNSSLQI